MRSSLAGFVWLVLYMMFCLLPLGLLIGQQRPPGRAFLVELSVALGFVALSILALQFALVARFKVVAAPFGIDSLLQYHRQISYVAVAFVLAHPVLLFIADAQYLELLKLWDAPWRARFAVTSVLLLLMLVALSLWRRRLRLSYETWQATHGLVAVAVVVLALLHASLVGFYVTGVVRHVVFDGYIGILLFLLVWIRVINPLLRLRKPWRVVRVDAERGYANTLVLEPVGHAGMEFDAGQFGWIVIGRSPFAISQNPFSFSSSADAGPQGLVRMTIKPAGDLSNSIPDVSVGTRVYLDGPHGVFAMEHRQAPGYVFIAGGVGITPFFSMLLTMQARGDVRPVTLLYANQTIDDIVFLEALNELSASMPNLTIVYVLADPPDSWNGETGRITRDVLTRHLPSQFLRYQYFVCGPSPLMDAMEAALVELGIPFGQVSTERFDMV